MNTVQALAFGTFALLASALAGCGARSALRSPEALDAGRDALADARTDARADAPRPDALPPRACSNDRACNDGLACTVDRCDPALGRCVHTPDDARCDAPGACLAPLRCDTLEGCVPGPARACDDGVACTVDRCDATRDRCAHEPDDARCPLSHGCDPLRGCFARVLAHGPAGLFDVRLPSGEASRRAGLPAGMTDLALRPDGALFGVGRGVLYQLDSNTGAALRTRPFDGVELTALDAAPDGALYAGAGAFVYALRDEGAELQRVAAFPPGLEASGDLAFMGDRLLATARERVDSLDTLVEFELRTGAARALGPVGFACVWGLAAFGDTLYGLTCNGEVLRIDARTGAGTLLTRGPQAYYGATAR